MKFEIEIDLPSELVPLFMEEIKQTCIANFGVRPILQQTTCSTLREFYFKKVNERQKLLDTDKNGMRSHNELLREIEAIRHAIKLMDEQMPVA